MDELLDKLKLLNYFKGVCVPNNLKPFHRNLFNVASENPNEQYYYFTTLFTWLLRSLKIKFDAPGQFDDPNAVATNIINEIKKLNIPFDYGPNKIKQGYGEAVLYVLNTLCDKVLTNMRFTFQKPVHRIDDYPEEAEVDDHAEITTENIDEIEEDLDEHEEEEEYIPNLDINNHHNNNNNNINGKPSYSEIVKKVVEELPIVDATEWRLEVERVTPLLKITLANDNKDWRIHLDQLKLHKSTIEQSFIGTQTLLQKLDDQIEKTLEKISSREKYINNQFESQTETHRNLAENVATLKLKYDNTNSNVTDLANELNKLTEEIDQIKSQMDEIGSGMTDSKPLIEIKQGMQKLKNDIKQLEVRTGVISNSLENIRLRNKTIVL